MCVCTYLWVCVDVHTEKEGENDKEKEKERKILIKHQDERGYFEKQESWMISSFLLISIFYFSYQKYDLQV